MKRAAATASSMCVTAHILLSGSASFLASTLLLGTPSGISSELILENDALSLLPILSGWDAPTKAIRGRSSVDDTLESLTGEVAAPQEWDSVGIDINDSGETKYAVFRKGANEEEVRAAIEEVCREVNEADPRLASIILVAEYTASQLGYQRTQWWFESAGTKGPFQTFFGEMEAVAHSRPLLVLEVGSFEGASAIWLSEHLLKHPDSLLICLDTWEGGEDLENISTDKTHIEDWFKWNIAKAQNAERVVAIKGDSLLSLTGLVSKGLSSSFDAIYVDASHQMKDALTDGLLSFRLLKVGGVMIFDDYVTFPAVEQATTLLEEAFGDSFEVLLRYEHLVVRKTAEDRWATLDSTPILGDLSRLKEITGGGTLSWTSDASGAATA